MKKRFQRLLFFCCNSSSNEKIVYPKLKPKLSVKQKKKDSAKFWRSVWPRARGNENVIDNTGHSHKQRRKQELMLSWAHVYILIWMSCAPLPSSSTIYPLPLTYYLWASTKTQTPQMWPGFNSCPVSYLGWVCCCFSPCWEGFSPGTRVFLPTTKPTFPISNLIRIEDCMKSARADVAFSLNIIFLI